MFPPVIRRSASDKKLYPKHFYSHRNVRNVTKTRNFVLRNSKNSNTMNHIKESWKTKGYADEALPEGIDLHEEIRRLCREKKAVIMAHYYTESDIQDVADFVGDSLALAQKAAQTDADIIVMCGVHFMGETNKILCPGKKVLLPDLGATCSLAESLSLIHI